MEHSRLLKFFVPERLPSKMAENNTQVESEVPSAQKLREDAEENADSSSKPMIISSFIEVHTEVGDGEKVVRRHQVIRNGETEKDASTEETQPTKIPISRLRQTVEKVKEKRDNSKEKPKESKIPRRTSIPKNDDPNPLPLDDEFDKLFQEVVNTSDNTVVASLESKFEEIIHDYDENKLQPIDVDKIKKSKIPFFKRRSLQDGDVVQLRTNKLIAARDKIRLRKSISYNEEKYEILSKDIVESLESGNEHQRSENTKHEIESTESEIIEKQNETDKIKITELENKQNASTKESIFKSTSNNTNSNKNEINLIKTIAQESQNSYFNNQTTELTQISTESQTNGFEKAKVNDMLFQEQNNNIANKDSKTVKAFSYENESSTSSKETKTSKYSNENDEKEPFLLGNKNITIPNQHETKFYKTFSIDSDNVDFSNENIIKKTKSSLENKTIANDHKITDITSNSIKHLKTNETEIFKNSKQYTKNISVEGDTVQYSVQVNNPEEKFDISEFIDQNLSQDTKIEEITTKRHQTNVIDYTKNISTNFEVESTHSYKINTDLRQNDYAIPKSESYNGKVRPYVLKEKERDALYATSFKGRVGRMISKIDSKETIEIERKNSIDELPKNKSVLSKIAMFERQEPEKIKQKNSKPKLTKLSTTHIQTEEVRVHVHTPLIVHEVFKPFQRNHALISENHKAEPSITEMNEHLDNEIKESAELPEESSPNTTSFRYEIPEPSTPVSDAPVIIPKIRPVKEILSKFEHLTYNNENPKKAKSFDNIVSKKVLQIKENKVDITPEDNKVKITCNTENQEVNEPAKTEFNNINVENEPAAVENNVLNKTLKTTEVKLLPNENVKNILHRIKSFDKFELNKKEMSINKKELPRSRSVLEKIALFEGKLTQAKGQDVETTTLAATSTVSTTTGISDDLQEKINELNTKYGTVDVPGVQLSNGVVMPVLAVGTANLNPKLIKHIIGAAIDMGYRAIDSAYIYGNEQEVGEAIRAKIEDRTVERKDLFIINKLWSTFHQEDLVKGACEASLKAMGLDYFDLYLVHNPMSFKEGPSALPKIATVIQYSQNTFIDAWHGMGSLITAKLVRAIGVSNFNSKQVQRVMDKGKVKPVINQVECHPYLSQERLGKFCTDRNITLSCYGVLGSKGTPAQYRGTTEAVIDDPLVKVLASGLGITPSQLLISYQLKNNHTVVVKSSSAAHLWENIQSVNVKLSSAEVEGLNMLNKNKRIFNFIGMGDTHKNYPFNIPF